MERIIEKSTPDEYKSHMQRYAIETNWKRHSSDSRDGLKTVQRRILDSLTNRLPGKTKFLKTAKVSGDIIGSTHPHGPSSVETAISTLVNWFSCKVPLLETESNMGSMQGASSASSRYTEVKLSEFAIEAVIAEMRNCPEVVNWRPTYDNTGKEPEYFPVAVPLLLINGTFGIGTGLKVYVPSHNLAEVIDATINLIKNPNYQVVLVPDQCMNVELIDTNWKSISNKGRGIFYARSVIDIEEQKNGCYDLIIKSVPDMIYFDKGKVENGGVKYNILELVQSGKIPQISNIAEGSEGDDMNIIISLKKGSDPEFVKQLLYKETALQSQYVVNFESLCEMNPVRFSYKAYLELFIEQRKTIKYRYACIQLQECNTKIHQLDAYIKMIQSGKLDEFLHLMQKQNTNDEDEIIEFLIKKIGLTDIQAKFMIGQTFKNVTKAKLSQYKEDLKKYQERVKFFTDRILNEKLIENDIIEELEYFKKKYGKPRTTRVISKEQALDIPKGVFKVVVTENNYIKKLNENDYVGAYRGDNPKHVILADNTENILLFSAQGRAFTLPVNKIPLCDKSSIGIDARIVIKKLASNIEAVMYLPSLEKVSKMLRKHYVTVLTNNNFIKKMDIEDFLAVPASGLLYTKLADGDSVKSVSVIPDDLDVIIYSDKKALRINMSDIPKYKRSSYGVYAMKTNVNIDGISVIYPDATDIVVITEKGMINKFGISGLPRSDRYTAGSSVIKLKKGDRIKAIYGVSPTDIITIYCQKNFIETSISDIKDGSSISGGYKITTNCGDVVSCVVRKN